MCLNIPDPQALLEKKLILGLGQQKPQSEPATVFEKLLFGNNFKLTKAAKENSTRHLYTL